MLERTLRVTTIRSQSPKGFGGCIFTGQPIDERGNVQDAASYFVVKANGATLGRTLVQLGQWWKVSGEAAERSLEVNGFRVSEWQVEAASALLVRPSGEHIVSFLADNPAFERIGQVKARKLWGALGGRLYEALDSADVDTLATVLTPESAAQVAAAWSQFGDSRTLQWLQAEGFDLELGRKVLGFFGRETPEKLQQDPYRLLSFSASWRQVDALARSHFEVQLDDPRRLQGAIEEACYRVFTAGHTTALSSTLMAYLQPVLGTQTTTFRWRNLISAALSRGLSNGSFVVGPHGVQPLGALVMELQVAKAVASRLTAADQALMTSSEVEDLLHDYEAMEGIELNAQQRHAVQMASSNSFVLITGGAGVGKTTVLKALYRVYDQAGIEVVQLALAGRAAKRMQEATGRAASTIANFLRAGKELSGQVVVVVDEASMVDIVSMYRLCALLGPDVRLVLAGDPEQLMPVGPGLVLHALIRVPAVPLGELKVIKRYGGDIAAAAVSIRKGIWPSLSADETDAIAFIPCADTRTAAGTSLLAETVLDLYRLDPANTQILSARRNGPDGVKTINSLCQAKTTAGRKAITVWSAQHGALALTGFNLGDPVLCTRNMWDRGLQNGSLGTIVDVEDATQPPLADGEDGEPERPLAWVLWDDGIRRPIVEGMLDDLELGYAITVHKAQGSQWPRIIVPLTGHRLLDRTLIYTAVTRAQKQVLIVGDEAAARAAVESPPRVQSRQVALDLLIRSALDTSFQPLLAAASAPVSM